MTTHTLATMIFACGLLHFSILVASSLVPLRLNWQQDLSVLPRLHRQMYWTYGGYVVLSIIAFGCICVFCSAELATRTPLARAVCAYVFVFWFVRLVLQAVFDVKAYLTAWWLRAGYSVLTVLFLLFAVTFGWAAFGPVR